MHKKWRLRYYNYLKNITSSWFMVTMTNKLQRSNERLILLQWFAEFALLIIFYISKLLKYVVVILEQLANIKLHHWTHRQCDQIGRFIGLWATFQRLWQQLICPNLLHFRAIFVKVSKNFFSKWNQFWPTFVDIWQLFTGHTGHSTRKDILTLYPSFSLSLFLPLTQMYCRPFKRNVRLLLGSYFGLL